MEPVKTRTSRGHLALYAIMLALFILDAYLQTAWGKERLCDDLRAGSIIGSHHPGDENEDANEKQWPSLFVQCDGFTLGFYQNSYSSDSNQLSSTLIGYEAYFNRGDVVEYSFMIGVVDGYPEKWKWSDQQERIEISKKKWLPWASFNVGIDLAESAALPAAKIWIIPDPKELGQVIVYGFGLEWRFN